MMAVSDEELRDLPSRALLVYRVLSECQPAHLSELESETLLRRSTLQNALNDLDTLGLLKKRQDPAQPRKKLYSLRDE